MTIQTYGIAHSIGHRYTETRLTSLRQARSRRAVSLPSGDLIFFHPEFRNVSLRYVLAMRTAKTSVNLAG